MLRGARELWLALLAILLISFVYLAVMVITGSIPAASEFFGHSLGILGFLLMLMTETLYSLRKRSHRARWGRTSIWLQFHIFTGLVGPYMVLLHSSWKFNGLAGVVMLLTIIITASGFVGRYIYTAVPRAADGAILEAVELEENISQAQVEIKALQAELTPEAQKYTREMDAMGAPEGNEGAMVLGRALGEYRFRRAAMRRKRNLNAAERVQAKKIDQLLARQRTLERQIRSIAMARRLLSLWHSVHIPLGVALFTTAFVHIIGAIYYATLLH